MYIFYLSSSEHRLSESSVTEDAKEKSDSEQVKYVMVWHERCGVCETDFEKSQKNILLFNSIEKARRERTVGNLNMNALGGKIHLRFFFVKAAAFKFNVYFQLHFTTPSQIRPPAKLRWYLHLCAHLPTAVAGAGGCVQRRRVVQVAGPKVRREGAVVGRQEGPRRGRGGSLLVQGLEVQSTQHSKEVSVKCMFKIFETNFLGLPKLKESYLAAKCCFVQKRFGIAKTHKMFLRHKSLYLVQKYLLAFHLLGRYSQSFIFFYMYSTDLASTVRTHKQLTYSRRKSSGNSNPK